MIDDSFIPMALYLIRQGRDPGCPTLPNGSADSAYCPAQDAAIIGAKFIPSGASLNSSGVLSSLPARRISWSQVVGAREQLAAGAYQLVYRVQNNNTSGDSYSVNLQIRRWHCPNPAACSGTLLVNTSHLHTFAAPGAQSDSFTVSLTQPAFQPGDWYEAILKVAPSGGGVDDFTLNDQKIFKFTVMPLVYLPTIIR